jgi:hypothetical protein
MYRQLTIAIAAALVVLNGESFAAPMPYGYGYPSYQQYYPQQYQQYQQYQPYVQHQPYAQYQPYVQHQPYQQYAPAPINKGGPIYSQYSPAPSGKDVYVPSPYGGSPSPYGQPPAPISTVNSGFLSSIRSMFSSPFKIDYENLGGRKESMYSINNNDGLNVKIRKAKNPANAPENQKILAELDSDGYDYGDSNDSYSRESSSRDYDDFSSCSCHSNVPVIPECVNACKKSSSDSSV